MDKSADYLDLLADVSESVLSKTAVHHHCFAGVGTKKGVTYFPIYLKPNLVDRR